MENNQTKSKRGGARPGSGRPKGSPNKATRDLKELAQVYTGAALQALSSIMGNSDSDAARVAAAKELLDRGYGKAHQSGDMTIKDERMVVEAPRPAADADTWASQHGPH